MIRLGSICRPAVCLGVVAVSAAGCHSAFVETTIENQTGSAVRLIEVDYPSASFGIGNLDPSSQFHYRFKVQGSGALKIEFTDASGKIHDSGGPELNQGQEGRLTIVLDPRGQVRWEPTLTAPK